MRRVLLVLAVLLALPVPAAVAAEPLWRVSAESRGSYTLDYGADGDAIDGRADAAWDWELRAVASGFDVDTDLSVFRMSVTGSSDIVQGSSPLCRPDAPADSVGWVRDSRAGLYLSSSGGFQVNHPFGDLLGSSCHRGAHGMTFYDGAAPGDTPVPRRAFRPRRDRRFGRTWTQQIELGRDHEAPPATPHAFRVDGTLTISVKRISKRAARTLRARLRRTAAGG